MRLSQGADRQQLITIFSIGAFDQAIMIIKIEVTPMFGSPASDYQCLSVVIQ